MYSTTEKFGQFSIPTFAVANIATGLLNYVEDNSTKLKAAATCGEITMMASGHKPQHFAWINFARNEPMFDGHFNSLSSFLEVGETGIRLLHRHIFRETLHEESRWIDIVHEGDTTISCSNEHNFEDVSKWLMYTSMFFHRSDNIIVTVPDEQTWF